MLFSLLFLACDVPPPPPFNTLIFLADTDSRSSALDAALVAVSAWAGIVATRSTHVLRRKFWRGHKQYSYIFMTDLCVYLHDVL
jgi:hypothetical protein